MTHPLRQYPMVPSFVPVLLPLIPTALQIGPICTLLKPEIVYLIISLHHHQKVSIVSKENCHITIDNTICVFTIFLALDYPSYIYYLI